MTATPNCRATGHIIFIRSVSFLCLHSFKGQKYCIEELAGKLLLTRVRTLAFIHTTTRNELS